MRDTPINAIIIDDEVGCIENLRYYLSNYCPDIRIIATADNLFAAKSIITLKNFDLAFLDIKLYNQDIFSVIPNQPGFNIVFVTAHKQYAFKAIKTDAIDFLLKPLLKQDIMDCYQRIQKRLYNINNQGNSSIGEVSKEVQKKIILKNGTETFIINYKDLCYWEAKGAYTIVQFYLNNICKSILISKPINNIEKENNHWSLHRVHKSYIVNLNRIKSISKVSGVSIIMDNNEVIPVAKRRVHNFYRLLNERY